MSEESVSSRAVPYHCPYCGETDLWPHEPTGWECRGCRRAFKVESARPHPGHPNRTRRRCLMTAPATARARSFRGTHTEGRSPEEPA
ncbi:hypothetical protein G5V59_02350 [Nocardioides sp. W3-2-3]|uniref:hypothetical protein n=1 Tax=Nocardioides convexus TaxID=2712224 RepID=UPI0031013FCE|nr:hypothetical protein [Nocardioides convexus]